MARLSSGSPLKGARGRIGNIVTYELNGVQVVRSLPSRGRKKKTSELQKLHLNSFKIQHGIARSLKHNIIDRIWSKMQFKGGMNAYNQFIKANRAAYGQSASITFPELFALSQGNLHPALNFKVSVEANTLVFDWENRASGRYASESDRLNLYLLESRRNLCSIEVSAIRQDGKAAIKIPVVNRCIEGYAFWSSHDGQDFSPSVYWKIDLE